MSVLPGEHQTPEWVTRWADGQCGNQDTSLHWTRACMFCRFSNAAPSAFCQAGSTTILSCGTPAIGAHDAFFPSMPKVFCMQNFQCPRHQTWRWPVPSTSFGSQDVITWLGSQDVNYWQSNCRLPCHPDLTWLASISGDIALCWQVAKSLPGSASSQAWDPVSFDQMHLLQGWLPHRTSYNLVDLVGCFEWHRFGKPVTGTPWISTAVTSRWWVVARWHSDAVESFTAME